METKFTKGNWITNINFKDYNRYLDIFREGEALPISSIWINYSNRCEAEANAKLMSASPNMLDALLSIYEDKEVWNELSDDQKQKVEESIKKATE